LDDPLLEITVPTMFVIGQNSSMCTLDDMEDFRERITKTLTALVVVGGCNDRLILSGAKKRTSGITQGMVDRCIADEIFEFVSVVISSTESGSSTPTSSTPNYRQLIATPASHQNHNSSSNGSNHNHNYHSNNSSSGGSGAGSHPYRRPVVKRPAVTNSGGSPGAAGANVSGGMPGVVKRRR
jgi:hypothetical protein